MFLPLLLLNLTNGFRLIKIISTTIFCSKYCYNLFKLLLEFSFCWTDGHCGPERAFSSARFKSVRSFPLPLLPFKRREGLNNT